MKSKFKKFFVLALALGSALPLAAFFPRFSVGFLWRTPAPKVVVRHTVHVSKTPAPRPFVRMRRMARICVQAQVDRVRGGAFHFGLPFAGAALWCYGFDTYVRKA